MAASEEAIAKRFADLIKTMTPQISALGDGLQITQNGSTFKIPFNQVATTTQSTQITKK